MSIYPKTGKNKEENVLLSGDKVKLRAYKKEDVPLACEYINDPEVSLMLSPLIPFPYKLEDEYKWYDSLGMGRDGKYNFAVERVSDGLYIGGCGINDVDWKNSVATVGIFICAKECGKGYGTQAMGLLIDFIFSQMNIHKIKLNVFSFNHRAIKSYEKLGFKKEGVLRQEIFRNGEYFDEIVMGLLKDEH